MPSRCWSPDDVLGNASAFGLIANLYTIRSETNWGIGDFSDLARLAEWGGGVGADFVGMNPLHALLNRGNDISPYSPVSRLFRNPIYIDVMRVPELRDATALAERMTSAEFAAELDALRETASVRYEQVMGVKGLALDALHHVFLARVRGSGDDRDRAYDAYLAANDPALTRLPPDGDRRVRHAYDWRTWPSEFVIRHGGRTGARGHAQRVTSIAGRSSARSPARRSVGRRSRGWNAHWIVSRSRDRNVPRRRRRLGVPRVICSRRERWRATGSLHDSRPELGIAADRSPSASPRPLSVFRQSAAQRLSARRSVAHRPRARSLPSVLDP